MTHADQTAKLAAAEPAPTRTLTLIEQLWQKLDGAYARWRKYRAHTTEELADAPNEIKLDLMQGRVEGLVAALTIMSAGVLDKEGVQKECLRRWKSRQPTS